MWNGLVRSYNEKLARYVLQATSACPRSSWNNRDDAESIIAKIREHDSEWDYQLRLEPSTGNYCILVLDEDRISVGYL
jgi:hypothetical protein